METVPQSTLVSPIVNRELEASVVAHSWPTTPQSIFCEAFAYHNNGNQQASLAVAFLERLVALTTEKQPSAAMTSYQNATDWVSQASPLTASAKRLFEYAVRMRASSPVCELHRGLARETLKQAGLLRHTVSKNTDAFCVVHPSGKVVLQEALLTVDWSSLVKQTAETAAVDIETLLLPDEVPIGGTNDDDKSLLVILYANLGSVTFAHAYNSLSQANVRFVVRHLGAVHYEEDNSSAIETVLQGYGVRLDIRNVEYKVFDDRSDKSTSEETGLLNLTDTETAVPLQYLAGVNLTALGLDENKTTLRTLWQAHDRQQAQSQILPPVWQRRQLPLQAAVVVASAKDPLATLQEVSQDLPSVASTLAYVKIPEDIQKVAEALENKKKFFRPGRLYINGRAMSMSSPTFNVFVLLNLMREEQAFLDEMQSMLGPYLEPAALQAVQRAWMMGDAFLGEGLEKSDEEDEEESTSDTAFRVDVGRGGKRAVMYLNNVEKDRQYAQWPKSLQQMLMSLQFGMPPAVRRNLFTVLAIVDPIAGPSNMGFDMGVQMMDRSFPIRIAVLLVNEDDVNSCLEWLLNNPSDEDTLCPVTPVFESKPTKESLKKIPATAQAVHRLFSDFSLEQSDEPGATLAYLEYLLSSIDRHKAVKGEVSMSDLIMLHGDLLAAMRIATASEAEATALETLLEGEDTGDSDVYLYGRALRFAADKAVTPGMSFLNGRPLPIGQDEDTNAAGNLFADEQKHIFGLIAKQEITDSDRKSVYGKLLTGKRVFSKCHPLLVAAGQENIDRYLQLDHGFDAESLVFPNSQEIEADANFVVEALIEFDTDDGLKALSGLLSVMDSPSTSVRVGYRIMPSTPSAARHTLCPLLSRASVIGHTLIKSVIDIALSASGGSLELKDLLKSLPGLSDEAREQVLSSAVDGPCADTEYLLQAELPSKNFILGNGRFYSIDGNSLTDEDIELLITLEFELAKAVTGMLEDFASATTPSGFDAATRVTAFLAVAAAKSTVDRVSMDQRILELEQELELEENPLRLTWGATKSDETSEDDSPKVCNASISCRSCLPLLVVRSLFYYPQLVQIHVVAVVDPLSESAQRLSPLLRVIRDQLNLPLTVILTPATLIDGESDVPITSYYRFVADSNAMPATATPKAHFSDLPHEHLLTLRMDVPEPWDVQQALAVQDTDNLRCDLKSGCCDSAYSSSSENDAMVEQEDRHLTTVEYGLSALLFFGQCYERPKSQTSGLQLALSKSDELGLDNKSLEQNVEVEMDGTTFESSDDSAGFEVASVYSDTLVMKNAGYWQLRANPGVWTLKLVEGSRGAEVFEMVEGSLKAGRVSIDKESIGKNSSSKTLVMNDFVNRGELLLVNRRPGFEDASLFFDKDDDKALLGSGDDDDVIHVFSLATGHLYERFLKIMMLSVTKRTSTKVKFWLFENFLSPTFKASARALAERIGCEVEFVTYKWPGWLRGQSEKQRIIWG